MCNVLAFSRARSLLLLFGIPDHRAGNAGARASDADQSCDRRAPRLHCRFMLMVGRHETAGPSLSEIYPARDFAAIIPLGNMPNVLVVAPSKGFRSLQDLVAAARARPGSIVYASGGVGSATHFSAERFRLSAGIEGVHVPFRTGNRCPCWTVGP
jgi:hypothetical protein